MSDSKDGWGNDRVQEEPEEYNFYNMKNCSTIISNKGNQDMKSRHEFGLRAYLMRWVKVLAIPSLA